MLPYPSGLLCVDLPGFRLETFLPQLPKYWGYKAASAELFVASFVFLLLRQDLTVSPWLAS